MAVKSEVVESGDAGEITPDVAILSVGDVHIELTLSEVYKLRSALRAGRRESREDGYDATARRLNDLKERLAPVGVALGGTSEALHEEAARLSE